MKEDTRAQIKELILKKVDDKLKKYEKETDHMPFFDPMFSQKHIFIASLIQSFYTTFGMSMYEQLAIILASEQGWHVERQYKLEGVINSDTILLIESICNTKSLGKAGEIERIRKIITYGKPIKHPQSVVDIFIRKQDGSELYIDITTVKSNLKEFRTLREKMLNWVALRLSQDPKAQVQTYIGLPYNPYHPNEYMRWTGLENDSSEILIQANLWNTLAGYPVYDDLIEIFKEVGVERKDKIAKYIIEKTKFMD